MLVGFHLNVVKCMTCQKSVNHDIHAYSCFTSILIVIASFQDEGDGGPEPEGEGEVEGQGEAEIESEGEPQDLDPLHGESEGEREKSSQEVEIGDQREESEERYSESDEKEEYGQRVVTSRRRNEVDSGSERSGGNRYVANEDDEVNQARSPRSVANSSPLSLSSFPSIVCLLMITLSPSFSFLFLLPVVVCSRLF